MRQPRLTYTGAFHHAMNRGINDERIFEGDRLKRIFLELLAEKVLKFRIRLFAYCLMDNHYHLVLQNTSGRLSDFFRNLNTHYAFLYRRFMGGKGYVFQSRYKSTLVEEDAYLKQVILYIMQNPRRAGIVQHSQIYQWSSEGIYYSKKKNFDWLDLAIVENLFADRKLFRSMLKGALIEKLPLLARKFGGVVGDKDFVKQALSRFERRRESYSHERRRESDGGFDPVEKVLMEFEEAHRVNFHEIDSHTFSGKRLRGELLVRLRDLAGLTLKEIIEYPPFADLKIRSLPHIYKIAKKRFYGKN